METIKKNKKSFIKTYLHSLLRKLRVLFWTRSKEFEIAMKSSFNELYLNKDDIEFLIENKEIADFLEKAWKSTKEEKYLQPLKENEKKLFAKYLFTWLKNYNLSLRGNPEKFAEIVFEAYEDQRSPATIKSRNLIKELCLK